MAQGHCDGLHGLLQPPLGLVAVGGVVLAFLEDLGAAPGLVRQLQEWLRVEPLAAPSWHRTGPDATSTPAGRGHAVTTPGPRTVEAAARASSRAAGASARAPPWRYEQLGDQVVASQADREHRHLRASGVLEELRERHPARRVHAVTDQDDGLALGGAGRHVADRLESGVVERGSAYGLQHV